MKRPSVTGVPFAGRSAPIESRNRPSAGGHAKLALSSLQRRRHAGRDLVQLLPLGLVVRVERAEVRLAAAERQDGDAGAACGRFAEPGSIRDRDGDPEIHLCFRRGLEPGARDPGRGTPAPEAVARPGPAVDLCRDLPIDARRGVRRARAVPAVSELLEASGKRLDDIPPSRAADDRDDVSRPQQLVRVHRARTGLAPEPPAEEGEHRRGLLAREEHPEDDGHLAAARQRLAFLRGRLHEQRLLVDAPGVHGSEEVAIFGWNAGGGDVGRGEPRDRWSRRAHGEQSQTGECGHAVLPSRAMSGHESRRAPPVQHEAGARTDGFGSAMSARGRAGASRSSSVCSCPSAPRAA